MDRFGSLQSASGPTSSSTVGGPQKQPIGKPGAWLYEAITEGYALREESSASGGEAGFNPGGSLPPLEHTGTVPKAKKDTYVAEGYDELRFYRCPPARSELERRRFVYFAPE